MSMSAGRLAVERAGGRVGERLVTKHWAVWRTVAWAGLGRQTAWQLSGSMIEQHVLECTGLGHEQISSPSPSPSRNTPQQVDGLIAHRAQPFF